MPPLVAPDLAAPPLAVPASAVPASALPAEASHGGAAGVAVGPRHQGRAHLTARADPGLVEDAYWSVALSWQGGGFVLARLQPVRDGVWRTTRPCPLLGSGRE